MSYFKKSNTSLILLVAILLATNIATVATIFYHQNKENEEIERTTDVRNGRNFANRTEERQGKFGQYMSDRLKLDDAQQSEFYRFRTEFHAKAESTSIKIQEKRRLLYSELSKEEADLEHLNQLADEIGLLHAELKKLSVEHYINMKEICLPEQQKELYLMFKAMFEKEARGVQDIHQRKYRNNRNRNNRN